jgi:hypothetical protein
LEKLIQNNPEQLEELANVIALLERQQKETIDLDQMDITSQNSHHRRRLPLPLELNCQIFECLKVPIQKNIGHIINNLIHQKLKCKKG